MDKSVIAELFKNLNFSEKEIKTISSKFEKIIVKKGDLVLKSNQKTNFQFFVQKGCLRTFHMNNKGKEHTLQFGIKDWWISDYTAYFTNGIAIMNIECIQDAVLYKITKQKTEELYNEVEGIETFFRKKLETAYSSFQKRILENLSKPAKERYISFLHTYPNIEKNIKNYHIASYLGITTESLSRIRKEIILH